jgi:tripartite-type tricarboxylate transporter receptor subunit TctC
MTDRKDRLALINRRSFLAHSGAGLAALTITVPGSALAAGYPEKPITVVVMFAAGGGTDTIMRKIADEMAKSKGWHVNVINKTGAVGAIATQYVFDQPSDGYTILGGSNFNKFVRVMGHIGADHVPWQDWEFMQAAVSLASWSVRQDSPFQTFNDVVEAAKANPGKVSISTSGTGGLWHEVALIVTSFADIKLKFVPYDGGKPATLAGLQGEVDVAGGGVHEHIDLVRAGELRPLQQTGTEDIVLEDGKITWPTVGNFLPDIKPFLPIGGTYNFIVKRDTPPEVLKEIREAFVAAAQSDSFKQMMDSKFFKLDIVTGEDADKKAARLETVTADTFNKFKDQIPGDVKTAEELGLPTPADFDSWWPPEGYEPPSS